MSCTGLNVFLVAWGTVEILLFAGIVFGWPSVVYVYKLEGFFNYLCDPTSPPDYNVAPLQENPIKNITLNLADSTSAYSPATPVPLTYNVSQNSSANVSAVREKYITCTEQDSVFNLIFTLAVVINGVSSFINGVMWDKFGTRFMRLIGMITFVPGLLLAAFATNEQPKLLYPAMILIAYGGYAILMTNFQLGNLIPKFRSTIISMYCGAYDSSAVIFVFVKLSYDAGMPIRYVFFAMVAMFSIVIISTFWYMPKSRIPFPLPTNYKLSLYCRDPSKSTTHMTHNLELAVNHSVPRKRLSAGEGNMTKDETQTMLSDAPQKPDHVSFVKEMLTAMFILDVVWLTLMRLQSWSFIGRLNPVLNRLSGYDKPLVSQYTAIYASMQFFAVFLAPLSGLLMDRKKSSTTCPQLKRIELIEVCIASFVIDNTAGLLLAIAVTIPVLEVQYFSFVCSVVHRALLYGPNSAFIAQAFSAANFGKLFGLAMTVSAAVSLLQYPLFILQEGPLDGDPFFFNVMIIVLMVVAYIHPLYIWRWCRVRRKQYNQSLAQSQPSTTEDAQI